MKNVRLGMLLAAASALAVPVAAQAQDRGDWHGRHGDGGRPEGAGRGQGQPNGNGGDWRQRGPQGQAPAPAAQPAPARAAPQFAPQQQARGPENDRRRDWQGQNGNGNWSRGQADGRRDFTGAVPPLQSQPAPAQRFEGNRGFAGNNPATNPGNYPRNNRGFDNRGDNRRDGDSRTIEVGRDNRGFDNRRFDNRGGDNHRYVEVGRDNRSFENRGSWQRNWRNQPRYDWQGWRSNNRGLFHAPRYYPPRGYGYGYRIFSPGFRLDPFFYGQSYWLIDPWEYRLPPAYGPYRWVRYYNDVLLVDITRGIVVDVIRDFFW